MGKLSKSGRLERLALKAARLVKKTERLLARIRHLEDGATASNQASDDPETLKQQRKDARRRARGAARKKSSVMARIESAGALPLVQEALERITRKPARKPKVGA